MQWGLSILFVRFYTGDKQYTEGNCAFNSLCEILWCNRKLSHKKPPDFQFSLWDSVSVPVEPQLCCYFQFSLWDSGGGVVVETPCIFLLSILFVRFSPLRSSSAITFYLSILFVRFFVESIQKFTNGFAFNSLCEIPRCGGENMRIYLDLSILFVRFLALVFHRHRLRCLAFNSLCEILNHIHSDTLYRIQSFQFSLWDSI